MFELLVSRAHSIFYTKRFGQFFQFCVVGGFGAIVNLSVVYFLTENSVHYLLSGAFGIESAILINFFANRAWTFRSANVDGLDGVLQALLRDHAVRSVGMGVNLAILFVLTDLVGVFYMISQVVGAVVAVVWNFAGNIRWTWGT